MLPAAQAAAVDAALAEIEAKRDAAPPDSDTWWAYHYARHVIRTFPRIPRALFQLRQHSRFTSLPEKADAYLEAFEILARHTGEQPLERLPPPPAGTDPDLFDLI